MDVATILTILQVIKMLQELEAGNKNAVEKLIIDNVQGDSDSKKALAKAPNEIDWNFVGKTLEAAGQAIGNIFGAEK